MRIVRCDSVVWKTSTDISAERQYLSTAQHHRRITQHYCTAVTIKCSATTTCLQWQGT